MGDSGLRTATRRWLAIATAGMLSVSCSSQGDAGNEADVSAGLRFHLAEDSSLPVVGWGVSILIRSSDGETVVDQDWIDARYGSELPGPDVRWRAERGTYSATFQVVACPASGCSLDDEGRIHLGTPHGEPCQADLDIPAHTDPVEWRAEFDLDSGSCTVG